MTKTNLYEPDLDEEIAYCDEYAKDHPVYENGKIVGYTYPNGSVVFLTDEEIQNN